MTEYTEEVQSIMRKQAVEVWAAQCQYILGEKGYIEKAFNSGLITREYHDGTIVTVESQYYAQPKTERLRRVSTEHVCCHCYANSKFVTDKDVGITFEMRGRAHLPMYEDCPYNGVGMI